MKLRFCGLLSQRRWVTVLALIGAGSGCANLPSIQENECGNAVVESGEDCDTFAESGERCYPASAEASKRCRFDCSDPKVSCPSGSACGADKVCYFGSGKYAEWGNPLSVSASRILLGDFDGDARDDLLTLGNPSPSWQRLPKLHFFDALGNVAESYDPKVPIVSPSLVTLTTEGDATSTRQQLLFSTDQGIATFSATTDRQVFPKAYPYQKLRGGWAYRVLPITGSSLSALHEGILLLYSVTQQDESQVTWVIGADTGLRIAELAGTASDFVGDPLAADVDTRITSPCAEYLYAYKTSSTAFSLELCDLLGVWSEHPEGPTPLATLPGGHVIGQPLRTGHIDDDETLDLVLADESGTTYVTFGLGDGTFASDLTNPDATRGSVVPVTLDTSSCPSTTQVGGFPLVLGDLNDDHRDDWVFPGGVLLTRKLEVTSGTPELPGSARLSGCPGNAPFVGDWTTAHIGDLTGDELPDLVAAAAGEPDMDFYLGTGLDRMNRFGITTEGSVTRLIGGDFDGDLIGDIAYSTRAVESDAEKTVSLALGEEAAIAFGTRAGAPSFVAKLGTFQNVKQLSSANYVDTDAISEFGIISEPGEGAGEELAVFVGNPGRHPIAALGLAIFGEGGPGYSATPLAAISGHFTEEPERETVVAVSCSCAEGAPCESAEYRMWETALSSAGNLEPPRVSRELPSDLKSLLSRSDELGLHLVAGDLHGDGTTAHPGDGRDELLVLASGTNDAAPVITLWPMSTSSNVFSSDPDAVGAGVKSALGSPTQMSGTLLPNSDPALIDLNADGFLDLVTIINQNGQNRIVVAWNDAHARCSLDDVTFLDLPTAAPLGLHERKDAGGRRLFAITASGTYEILPAVKGSRKPKVSSPFPTTRSGEFLPGGKALGLGDMTGDGLLDFVIADRGTVHIFAEERLPAGAKQAEVAEPEP